MALLWAPACGAALAAEVELETQIDPAAAAREDARLAEGVARLNAGDTAAALAEFEAIGAANPKRVEAHYYIGVALAQLGRAAEAEPHLSVAVALAPSFIPAQFDLAVLQFRRGADAAALRQFEELARLDPTRARLHYYQGLIQWRRGERAAAVAKLARAAELDPLLAREADYYRALVAGDRQRAATLLREIVPQAPERALAAAAGEGSSPGAAGPARPVELFAAAGLNVDDNVILEPSSGPSPATITDEDDLVATLYLRGHYRWLDRGPATGLLEYSVYQNLHRDRALRDFNIQDHTLHVAGGARRPGLAALLHYEIQLARLGGERYLLRQGSGPGLTFTPAERHETAIDYRIGRKRFSDIDTLFPANSDRDVTTHTVGAAHGWQAAAAARLRAAYAFERERAGDDPLEDDWSFAGHRFAAGAQLDGPWKLRAEFELEWVRRRYDHDHTLVPGDRRDDTQWLALATLARPITRQVETALQFLHDRNESNIAQFEYRRNIYGLALTAHY